VLANRNDVRNAKKGKIKAEKENMDESPAVYP
jgi:hypothetical protein